MQISHVVIIPPVTLGLVQLIYKIYIFNNSHIQIALRENSSKLHTTKRGITDLTALINNSEVYRNSFDYSERHMFSISLF